MKKSVLEIDKFLTALERHFHQFSTRTLRDLDTLNCTFLSFFQYFFVSTIISNIFHIFNLQKTICLQEKIFFGLNEFLKNYVFSEKTVGCDM